MSENRELQLEVELDLPMELEHIEAYERHRAAGMSECEAATRTAQDILGGGVIVQAATAVLF